MTMTTMTTTTTPTTTATTTTTTTTSATAKTPNGRGGAADNHPEVIAVFGPPAEEGLITGESIRAIFVLLLTLLSRAVRYFVN